jgi:acyl-CoA dehydrogenase
VSETQLLEQVTGEILGDYLAAHPPAQGDEGWAPVLWATLTEAGLPLVGVPEELGGAGGDWPDLVAVLRSAGRFGAPVPLAETCALAGWLLSEAGLPIPDGPLTVAPTLADDRLVLVADGDGWLLRGCAGRVPWASRAAAIVVLATRVAGQAVAVVSPADCRIEPGANLAGEPRDRATFEDVRLGPGAVADVSLTPDDLLVRGALVRSIQMVGTLDRLLELTVAYAQARTLFGLPGGRFQAVLQVLALLAGECVAIAAAVEGAVAAVERGVGVLDCVMEVAAAKVRTAEASALATRIAHQLHGAIGFTQEHQLHRFTTRLWSWRDEFGSERSWAIRLGRLAAAGGPDGYWDWVTGGVASRLAVEAADLSAQP